MMTIHPKAEDDGKTFTICVPNEFTRQDFQGIRPRIEQHLRSTLSNEEIKMEIKLEETHETTRYLSPREQYNELVTQHPLLEQFTKVFDLDLS